MPWRWRRDYRGVILAMLATVGIFALILAAAWVAVEIIAR